MRLNRLVVAALAVSLVVGGAACGDDDGGDDTTAGTSDAAATVTISDFTFSPDRVEVNVGEAVKWTNDDSAPHQVVANDDSYKSERLEARGSTYQHTYDKAGSYEYHCGVHPSMTGTVEVS